MFTSVLVLNPHNLRLNKRRNVESPEEVASNKSDRRATSRGTYPVTHRSSSRQAVYIFVNENYLSVHPCDSHRLYNIRSSKSTATSRADAWSYRLNSAVGIGSFTTE